MSAGKPNVRLSSVYDAEFVRHNLSLFRTQDPTANDAALAAALAAWDSGVRVRRRGEPSRSSLTSDAVAMADGHSANGKVKRSKSSDDESLGDECEYNLQGILFAYSLV
jgi:hypothetical protein